MNLRGRVLACSAALIAVLALVATASAGKTPDATLVALQGVVTSGQNAAFMATFSSPGNSQTHAEFHAPVPAGNTGPVYASCPYALIAGELVCNAVKVAKGEVAKVTVVWRLSQAQYSAYWTTDAGTNSPTKPKKRSDVGPASVDLVAPGNPTKTGSYILSSCSPNPTLQTPQTVSPTNPLATSVCIPGFMPPSSLLPGLLGSVEETNVAQPFPQQSSVCIAVQSCTTPFHFTAPITFTFRLNESSFDAPDYAFFGSSSWHPPASSPITQVFHNNVLVPSCAYHPTADPCVQSISSNGYGTTTVVAKGTENGDWRFG